MAEEEKVPVYEEDNDKTDFEDVGRMDSLVFD